MAFSASASTNAPWLSTSAAGPMVTGPMRLIFLPPTMVWESLRPCSASYFSFISSESEARRPSCLGYVADMMMVGNVQLCIRREWVYCLSPLDGSNCPYEAGAEKGIEIAELLSLHVIWIVLKPTI